VTSRTRTSAASRVLEKIAPAAVVLAWPIYVPARTVPPMVSMKVMPKRIPRKGMIRFTAASAVAPTWFPMKIPSTMFAVVMAMSPAREGSQSRKKLARTEPVSMGLMRDMGREMGSAFGPVLFQVGWFSATRAPVASPPLSCLF